MTVEQNSFITNQEKLLSDIMNRILPKTASTDILVGYFYFSGYKLLAENLADKQIRILVGLDIDTQITKYVREVDSFARTIQSRGQIREDFFNQFIRLFNDTDFLDGAEQLESFAIFLHKIKDGSLEIRKTEDPCHAKMYLFEYRDEINEGGEQPGCVITGSSNLSYQGLAGRVEINARFNDKQSYIDAQKIFNELWKNSVVIVDANNLDTFNEKVIKHIWYEKLHRPYLMYIRVLHEYFSIPSKENILMPYDITEGRYSNLKYQTDAVQLALHAIENHNGAIIADVVGLGKSIIASTVARNLGMRCIIVAPPHLKLQWEAYRDEFGFTASVFSSGQIEHALTYYREIVKEGETYLIIIDEAHRFRNEYTQDYTNLHNLCSGNKVLLLTATPFNNRPEDIYSMLKLFQIPSKSTLKTVENLGASFRELIAAYKQLTVNQREGKLSDEDVKRDAELISKRIRSIISPLVIRRSRIDLQEIPSYREDLKLQHIEPLIPDDPVELEYDLSAYKELYLDTLDLIDPTEKKKDEKTRFKSARYMPVAYVIPEMEKKLAKELEDKTGVKYNLLVGRQINVSSFMRKLLVQRFESSVAAFQRSLDFMIRSNENILAWIEKVHKIPVFKKGNLPDVTDFYESTDDGMEEIEEAFERYTKRGFFEIDMKYIQPSFVEDVKSDISVLKSIQEKWFGKKNEIRFDPKLESFKKVLCQKLEEEPERKLIVFSAFADTVDYLGKVLSAQGNPYRILKYTSADSSAKNKELIRTNFDAGLKIELQQNTYQVLIATDAISEGYNLHRAGAIFNYDIPYNPTRVIQRIGRINRINKKVFDHLYIYNYFPTDVGETEVRTKEISTLKMAMIHAIMGEDTKVLTKDEELRSYFAERYRKELAKNETASWDNRYRTLLDHLKGTDEYQAALAIPHRSRIARHIQKPDQGVLLFGKKGNDFIFKIGADNGTEQLSAEEAIALFEAMDTEEPFAVSADFDRIYQRVKRTLFNRNTPVRHNQEVLKALSKIKVMIDRKAVDADYLQDLKAVAESDGLSGYELRYINKLLPKEYTQLPDVITSDYLIRVLETSARVMEGEETLILSEEIITP